MVLQVLNRSMHSHAGVWERVNKKIYHRGHREKRIRVTAPSAQHKQTSVSSVPSVVKIF